MFFVAQKHGQNLEINMKADLEVIEQNWLVISPLFEKAFAFWFYLTICLDLTISNCKLQFETKLHMTKHHSQYTQLATNSSMILLNEDDSCFICNRHIINIMNIYMYI